MTRKTVELVIPNFIDGISDSIETIELEEDEERYFYDGEKIMGMSSDWHNYGVGWDKMLWRSG